MFAFPHGIHVDAEGNVWVTDMVLQDGRGQGAKGIGQQVIEFSPQGKELMRLGRAGVTGAGEFSSLHALAIDSRGRLFIGDRDNNRIQIYTQDGTFLESWSQFGRPSGIYIDRNDNMYVADSESETGPDNAKNNAGWKRGIRVGSAKDGVVRFFIPDPNPVSPTTSAAEVVAADRDGIIYGAEVQQRNVMRYVRR
jgi:sugar lactone lactonase YvrE